MPASVKSGANEGIPIGGCESSPAFLTQKNKAMERFFSKVEKTETCWNWTACKRGKAGYGAINVNGKVKDAHRLSYELHKGEIPEGLMVLHTCDNRLCVNPEHLFLGTAKDNWHDGFNKGRIKLMSSEEIDKMKNHPSLGAYRRGCRCRECTDLKTKAVADWRWKQKIKENQTKGASGK